jgi:hypothetical protein
MWLAVQGVSAANNPSSAPAMSGAGSVLLGTWEADLEHSTFKGRLPYKSGRMMVTLRGNALFVALDVVTASGASFHIEYTDALNGKPAPVLGDPYYDTETTVFASRLRAMRTEYRAGRVTGHTQFAVARDGASLIASSSRTTPEDGHLYVSVIRWKRLAH